MTHNQSPDVHYKTHEGFALYTDVSDTVLDYLAAQPMYKLDVHSEHEDVTERGLEKLTTYGLAPSQIALIGVQRQISKNLIFNRPADSYEKIERLMGVTPQEYNAAQRHAVAAGGFEDFDFIYTFTPALAAAVVHEYVDNRTISQDQYDNFTLSDWASVIDRDWFSTLTHDLALAGNGSYGTFGAKPNQHVREAFHDKFKRRFGVGNAEPFECITKYSPEDEYYYRGAKLTGVVRAALRASRDTQKSLGCPVARYASTFDNETIKNDTRVQNLLTSGRLQPSGKAVQEGHTHLVLQQTAIDRTLELFAAKLREYDTQFGTPRVYKKPDGAHQWTHLALPPQDVMRYRKESAEPN